MEAVVFHGSLDQSLSPYKSNYRNPRKIPNPLISWPSDSFLGYGLLQAPPPFPSHSFSPYSQPPLLPLPSANPRRSVATHAPAYKKTGNGGTPKKSKSKSPKKEGRNSPKKPASVSPTRSLGPGPKDSSVISSSLGSNGSNCISRSLSTPAAAEVDVFSGSAVFTISPPPSSVPLPTFFLRAKLSCKAEAGAGVDAGATDDLRRLLRLR